MKKIRYCKITILILAGWAILSAIGFLGKDTIYSRYTVDPVKTPYFVLVMQAYTMGFTHGAATMSHSGINGNIWQN